jgi:gas vesicle protein
MTDRFDNNEGAGGFVIGLLTGTVLGVGLGMLFAPKVGSELRNQLSEQAGSLANQAQEGYRKASENAAQWAAKRKETAGDWAARAREAVSRGAEEAQKYTREATAAVTGATPAPAGSTSSNAPISQPSPGSTSYPRTVEGARSSGSSASSWDSPSGPSGRTPGDGSGYRPS